MFRKPRSVTRPLSPRLPKRMRMDAFIVLLVLVLAGLAQQVFCGSDTILRALTGEPAMVESAPPRTLGDAAAAEMAHESLEPQLNCEGMPETGEPVRFLMQNVQNYFVAGEQQRSRYVTRPKSEAAREALVRSVVAQRPDVIGLVEIGGPLALQDFRLRLERAGLSYPYYRVLIRQGEDRALGVLSRLPIVADASRAQMPLYGQGRRMMLRGLLDITVRTEDGRLFRLLGAHLKSRVGDDPAAAEALRNKEAHTLSLYVQEAMKRAPKLPILVFGDWNDTPEDGAVKLMLQSSSPRTALWRLSPKDAHGEEWTHCYRRAKSYYVFDHIFFNPVLKKRVKAEPACGIVSQDAEESDHRALWCELR